MEHTNEVVASGNLEASTESTSERRMSVVDTWKLTQLRCRLRRPFALTGINTTTDNSCEYMQRAATCDATPTCRS